MSVEITLVSCSKCDFKSTTSSIYGSFKYLLPNNQIISADRTAGWCYSCNNIMPVECLPDASKLNTEMDRIKGELRDLTKFFSISRLLPSKKRKIDSLKSNLYDIENNLYFLTIRKGPPVCLICGSKEIVHLDLSSNKNETEHPICGGKLSTKQSDFRVHYFLLSRLFDVEGNKIQESNL